jgi:hypothetical protein
MCYNSSSMAMMTMFSLLQHGGRYRVCGPLSKEQVRNCDRLHGPESEEGRRRVCCMTLIMGQRLE